MGSHSCNLVIKEEHITYYYSISQRYIMKVIWKHCTDYELVQPSVHSDWEYELCTVGSLLNTFHLLYKIFLLNYFSNTKDSMSATSENRLTFTRYSFMTHYTYLLPKNIWYRKFVWAFCYLSSFFQL